MEEVVLLVLTAVGTAAAIAAAVFSYPGWRDRLLKPRLEVHVRNVAGYQQSGPIITKANLELELHNTGRGEASNWRIELQTRGPGSGSMRLPNPRVLGAGEEHYQLPGHEVVAWRAVDTSEVVPPGDKSRGLGPAMIDLPSSADFVCDYSITARRMKKRTGTITVSHKAPEARVQ